MSTTGSYIFNTYLYNIHLERLLLINTICGFSIINDLTDLPDLWMSNTTIWTSDWVTDFEKCCSHFMWRAILKGWLSTDWQRQIGWPTYRSKHDTRKTILLYWQGHLHILELEVVLEGIGRDEPQLTWCDRAGEGGKHKNHWSVLIEIKHWKSELLTLVWDRLKQGLH